MAAPARSNPTSFLRRFESMLLGSSAPARGAGKSPFAFGVVNARQFAAVRKTSPAGSISRDLALTVQEARERIREFIAGTYSPKRIPDLVNYLAERMLRIEARRGRDGRVANYLVDAKTRSSVSAALVDKRLSRPGMARMFGSTLEAEAQVVRRQRPRSPEEVVAHQLRNANAGRLLMGDANASPFSDWADLSFAAPALFQGREFAAQGRDTWVGIVHARASEDPEENIRVLREAHAAGRKLIVPARSPEDARAGKFVPGMPILLRDGAVRTRLISPNLTFETMSERFGKDPFQHYEDMATNYASKVARRNDAEAGAKVVDMQNFRKKFLKKQQPQQSVPRLQDEALEMRAAFRPGKHVTVVHTVDSAGRETMSVVDVKNGTGSRFDPSRMEPGTYIKEDAFGLPSGKIVIDMDGGYSHLDDEGRFHNEIGPAIVPPKGSSDLPRYAIAGEFQDRRRNTVGDRSHDAERQRNPGPAYRA